MLSEIPEIVIKLGDREYSLNFKEELLCAEETINENLKNQPSFFAYYAVLAELSDAALAETKLTLEIIEAELDAKVREELVKSGSKATETLIRGKIVLEESYLAAISTMNSMKKNVGVLKAIKEAFAHRKDMLVTLASNMRAQQDPEIFIKKQELREKGT